MWRTNQAGLPQHDGYGRLAAFFDWHPRRKWAILFAVWAGGGFIARPLADPMSRSEKVEITYAEKNQRTARIPRPFARRADGDGI